MAGREVRLSFFIAWMVISAVLFGVLFAPLILPTATIQRLEPRCKWKVRYAKECPMCGMTTSFILICRGKFKEASAANKASIPLFSILTASEVGAILLLGKFFEEGRHFLLAEKQGPSTEAIASGSGQQGGTLCRS
jgi:ribosomal protein S14